MNKFRLLVRQWLPAALTLLIIFCFYHWTVDQRVLYLVVFILSGAALAVLFVTQVRRADRPAQRMAVAILISITIMFFLVGYLFFQFNRTIVREGDRTATLQKASRYRAQCDDFFLQQLRRAEDLKNRLTSAPVWNQAKILNGFFENHADEYIAVLILDTSGVAAATAPSPMTYRETSNFRTLDKPTFGEPEFNVRFGSTVDAPLSSIKLFAPYQSGEGFDYWLVFNIRFEPLRLLMKEQFSDVSYYLLRQDEVLLSNERSMESRDFKNFTAIGYHEDILNKLFITRANLSGISWQTVSVQPMDEAFPNVVLADDYLIRILILGGLAGIALGLTLSLCLFSPPWAAKRGTDP